MRNAPFWWIFLALVFLLDCYVFQVIRALTAGAVPRTRFLVHGGYWLISLLSISFLILLPYLFARSSTPITRNTFFALIAGLFFAKLIAAFFFLTDDLRRILQWAGTRLFYPSPASTAGGDTITRSAFLSWAGMLVGSGFFGVLTYGLGNKYRYEVRSQKLHFRNLPSSFNGLRIVQISDIHAGSFTDKQAVMRGVNKIKELKPDLILFTGDLVNNMAGEMDEYHEVFGQLQAPLGVYSVLGNHDYGDYVKWESAEAKATNLQQIVQAHAAMGWKLLMNEHVMIEKGGEKMAVLGIENWSARGNFAKYGDLSLAYKGSEPSPFKILLSHDPSHWRAQVLPDYTDIDLTLSGHTHGMQFGVELPGWKWSPVQYMYNEWGGLYSAGKQQLYVNRGFGFLGYPGRVGIMPEITLLELFSKD